MFSLNINVAAVTLKMWVIKYIYNRKKRKQNYIETLLTQKIIYPTLIYFIVFKFLYTQKLL